jgi:hypothetical protein
LAICTVDQEFLNSSHDDFINFDEVFFKFFFIDLWSLGVDGFKVLLEDFEPIAFGHIDFDNLSSELKNAHLLFVGMS